MLKTYRGYLEHGRFIPAQAVIMPEKARVLVTLLEDNSVRSTEEKPHQRLKIGKYEFTMSMKPLEL